MAQTHTTASRPHPDGALLADLDCTRSHGHGVHNSDVDEWHGSTAVTHAERRALYLVADEDGLLEALEHRQSELRADTLLAHQIAMQPELGAQHRQICPVDREALVSAIDAEMDSLDAATVRELAMALIDAGQGRVGGVLRYLDRCWARAAEAAADAWYGGTVRLDGSFSADELRAILHFSKGPQ